MSRAKIGTEISDRKVKELEEWSTAQLKGRFRPGARIKRLKIELDPEGKLGWKGMEGWISAVTGGLDRHTSALTETLAKKHLRLEIYFDPGRDHEDVLISILARLQSFVSATAWPGKEPEDTDVFLNPIMTKYSRPRMGVEWDGSKFAMGLERSEELLVVANQALEGKPDTIELFQSAPNDAWIAVTCYGELLEIEEGLELLLQNPPACLFAPEFLSVDPYEVNAGLAGLRVLSNSDSDEVADTGEGTKKTFENERAGPGRAADDDAPRDGGVEG